MAIEVLETLLSNFSYSRIEGTAYSSCRFDKVIWRDLFPCLCETPATNSIDLKVIFNVQYSKAAPIVAS